MKEIRLGSPPADDKGKLDWCVKAIQQIANGSRENDPNKYADDFTLSGVSESRTLNAATATLAELRQVVATFIQDFKRRGSKRT